MLELYSLFNKPLVTVLFQDISKTADRKGWSLATLDFYKLAQIFLESSVAYILLWIL